MVGFFHDDPCFQDLGQQALAIILNVGLPLKERFFKSVVYSFQLKTGNANIVQPKFHQHET